MNPNVDTLLKDSYAQKASAWKISARCVLPKFLAGLFSLSALLNASTPTATTLYVSPPSPKFGQVITLIASVSPATAPGFVSFVLDGGTSVGSGIVNGSGIAQVASLTLPAGTHSLTAFYGGNAAGGYAASQSLAVAYTATVVPLGFGYQSPVNYGAGNSPSGVAVGDFDGDGKADLAVSNQSSNNVNVLLGNGDGTFRAAVNYGAGSGPYWVTVGDFNSDGKADLAVANGSASDLSILLGNGDGTFQGAVNYATGSQPAAIALGDFNKDGIQDLAVANYSGDSVSILLGKGDGTFQGAVNYIGGNGDYSVAVGDFNGDGKADLVVGNLYGTSVFVLLGNGDGTFQSPVNYSAGDEPKTVAVGDFNGDGKADVAVANALGNNVSILLGNGNGTFQAAVNYGAGPYPSSVAVGDFNADGKPDLVVTNAGLSGIPGNVSLLLGNGDGTFQSPLDYAAGVPSGSVAVVNLDGSGKAELVFLTGGVSVLLPSLARPANLALVPGTIPQSAFIGTTFANVLAVKVTDAGGAPVPGVTVTFAAPLGGPSGFFAGFTSQPVVSDASGIAAASPFTANGTPGSYTVSAAAMGLASVKFSLTNLEATMSVNPGTTPQKTQTSTSFPHALSVTVRDGGGNPVPGISVTFSSPNPCIYTFKGCVIGKPSAFLGATNVIGIVVVTDSSGIALTSAKANNIPGSYSVTASATGMTTLNFALTNCGPIGFTCSR